MNDFSFLPAVLIRSASWLLAQTFSLDKSYYFGSMFCAISSVSISLKVMGRSEDYFLSFNYNCDFRDGFSTFTE